jgi:hypothetical protein
MIKFKIEDPLKLCPMFTLGASTTCILFTVLIEESEMIVSYMTLLCGGGYGTNAWLISIFNSTERTYSRTLFRFFVAYVLHLI